MPNDDAMRPTDEQIEALKRLETATIHEAQGQVGTLDAGIKPVDPLRRLAGPALTVDCLPHDNLAIHLALAHAKPGDVLTLAAQKRGIAGLVIDGAIRDSDTIIDMEFPVFARGLSIKATHKNHAGRIGGEIICGGQAIRSGDVVVGDRDGLVVFRAGIDPVIALSEAREAKEKQIRDRLGTGELTIDILQLSPTLERLGAAASPS